MIIDFEQYKREHAPEAMQCSHPCVIIQRVSPADVIHEAGVIYASHFCRWTGLGMLW